MAERGVERKVPLARMLIQAVQYPVVEIQSVNVKVCTECQSTSAVQYKALCKVM